MKVCIFGIGRIGLPIALVSADAGYNVVGIDVNDRLVSELRNGTAPFQEPGIEELLKKHINKNFLPALREEGYSHLKDADYILICVGTEFTKYPEKPTLKRLFRIVDDIVEHGLEGKTIIMRVTLPVGTLDRVKERIESKSGLKEGKDFFLGFVPERLMEGKAVEEERKLPKIVGVYSDESFVRIKEFFSKIGGDVVRVSSPRTAEFIKLIDNAWRNLKFAFANELAYLAERNGIDVMEAINSANRGYQRNQIPVPGPVSGYCLGKDPYLLELAFEEIEKLRGFNSVWYYGRRANDWMMDKVLSEISGDKVLVAGLTFKRDIDDFRYSFGIYLVEELIRTGKVVMIHDPFMGLNHYTTLPQRIKEKVKICEDIESYMNDVNTIIFAANHSEYYKINLKDIDDMLSHKILLIDLWNIFYPPRNFRNIVYQGLGVRMDNE